MRPRILLAGLAALTLAAQTQPTFYAAYEDGREAAAQGQWRLAAAAFLRARALRPEPAARVIIYGNNLLKDYYPYSSLARCYLELGEPEAAAAMLRQAEARGEPAALREPLARRLPGVEPSPSPAASAPPRAAAPPSHAAPQEPAPREPAPLPGPASAPELERSMPPMAPLPVPAASVPVLPLVAVAPRPAQAPVPSGPAPQVEPIRPLPRFAGILAAGVLAGLGLLFWRGRRPTGSGAPPARRASWSISPSSSQVPPHLRQRSISTPSSSNTIRASLQAGHIQDHYVDRATPCP